MNLAPYSTDAMKPCTLKCQINEGPNKQGSEKILKFNKWGVGMQEKVLNNYEVMKEQKWVVRKQKTTRYTEACYFSMKTGCK